MRACRTSNLNTANLSLATKADVEAHFATHGTGTIKEIKLMNGFGFIEYEDAMDARDVVPGNYPAPPLHRKQKANNFTSSFPYVTTSKQPHSTFPLPQHSTLDHYTIIGNL